MASACGARLPRVLCWRDKGGAEITRRILGLVLAFAVGIIGCAVWPSKAMATPPLPSLVVQPTSGPVGSVVSVRVSAGCGQVVFGPVGATTDVTALGTGARPFMRYVIPGFVGIPASPVVRGRYAFGVSCFKAGSVSSIDNLVTPFTVTSAAAPTRFVAMAHTPDGGGYWLAQADGSVQVFGDAYSYGSLTELGVAPTASIVAMAATTDGRGYWLVGADGGVFAFGDASFMGSLPSLGVKPIDAIVAAAATTDGKGYWLLGADGGVFAFGDGAFCPALEVSAAATLQAGSLVGPIMATGITGYPGSLGYATVDSDASGALNPLPGYPCAERPAGLTGSGQFNVFASTTSPITAIAAAPGTGGVWLVGADGGVFAPPLLEDDATVAQAPFFGSLPSLGVFPTAPIVGIDSTPNGGGYWLLGADGGVFAFGSADFFGSAAP